MPSSIPHHPLPRLIIYVNNIFGYGEWHIYHKHILRFTTKFNRRKKKRALKLFPPQEYLLLERYLLSGQT